ncbi:hypothetical protein TSAR_007998 [Trichomalopsis sarcophagae]|uniref:DUF4817 domain-containing protein n=1 Tax=Trichomalopsis sarcophagae TaxID=543379 RepID=A0A232FNB3_9HYME|nr:hypothetical protein TSAR_007998 [Trichomalopsis sarcophagae]
MVEIKIVGFCGGSRMVTLDLTLKASFDASYSYVKIVNVITLNQYLDNDRGKMADYPANDIIDILFVLGEYRQNYRRSAVLYRERFPRRRHPNANTIRFLELRARRGYLRRQRLRRNIKDQTQNVCFLAILAMVHLDPHISLRTIRSELGVPRSTCKRYLKFSRYHPYHITLNQDLNEQDRQQKVQFRQWARNQIRNEPNFFQFMMFRCGCNRWIGRGGPIAWPPRLPDLTPLDFYLWGYLKDTVYSERPTTANDMRMRNQNACANIPLNLLIRTIKLWVLNIKFVSIAIKIPFEVQTQHITLKRSISSTKQGKIAELLVTENNGRKQKKLNGYNIDSIALRNLTKKQN